MKQLRIILLKNQKIKLFNLLTILLGQQCFCFQWYGHLRSESPTYLRLKGKVISVTLSNDEDSDHESESDQEGNFMAFTAITENANLQEAYNNLCKIAAKDAMNVELGLKKINNLEQEKKILLVKLFNANELITTIKIKNMSLVEKVRNLDFELFVTRKQLDRTSTSKLDNMLNV